MVYEDAHGSIRKSLEIAQIIKINRERSIQGAERDIQWTTEFLERMELNSCKYDPGNMRMDWVYSKESFHSIGTRILAETASIVGKRNISLVSKRGINA